MGWAIEYRRTDGSHGVDKGEPRTSREPCSFHPYACAHVNDHDRDENDVDRTSDLLM
jgi:hypothetical protein